MILYDPAVIVNYRDYGIMLPIPSDRGKRVLEFLGGERPDSPECPVSPLYPVLDFKKAQIRLGIEGQILQREDLERVHSEEYTARLYGKGLQTALLNAFELIDARGRPNRYEPDRARRPLSDMFHTLIAQAGGTYLASLLALQGSALPGDVPSGGKFTNESFCYYLGGGMHHARYDAPSGFCLINDAAIAAFKVISGKPVRLIWIIDMDAHKGDGTAELIHFARERGALRKPRRGQPEKAARAERESGKYAQTERGKDKPCILTLSIHMAKGWPLDSETIASADRGRAPLLPSDVDIGIGSGEEDEYTARLAEGLRELERLSDYTPDLALVVDGADPYEHDGLPSSSLLRLTLEQCIKRDTHVFRYLQDRKIPSAWIQAGGYGDRAWEPPAHFLQAINNA